MRTIRQIGSYMEVMFSFPPKLRYFAEVEAACGTAFCTYEDGAPVGILLLKPQGNAFDTVYLYVAQTHRRMGVARQLAEHAAAYARAEGKLLRFRVLENGEYAEACGKIARSLHMCPESQMVFFELAVNGESRRAWEAYRPEMIRLAEKVQRKLGRQRVVPFADADKDALERLREKIGREMPPLNPFALPALDPEYSMIAIRERDGEPVAFIAVRTVGNRMVFEISAAARGQTCAVMAQPFLDKLFAGGVERVTCAVRSGNAAGFNHVKGRFGFLLNESGRQTTYVTQS